MEERSREIIVSISTVLPVHEIATQYGSEVWVIDETQCEAVHQRSEPVDRRGNQQASGLQDSVCFT